MRLREIRRAKNITQQQLGDIIGVTNSVISKYENGLIVPPADKLARMAEFLQVRIDELFDSPIGGENDDQEKMPLRKVSHKESSVSLIKSGKIKERVSKYIGGDKYRDAHVNVRYTRFSLLQSGGAEWRRAWKGVNFRFFIAALSLSDPPISQAQLAKQLNISPETLSRIVAGQECSIREEWIPVLTDHLMSCDFSVISSSLDTLQAIASYAKAKNEFDDIVLSLQKLFSARNMAYIFDDHYWGVDYGIIRFYEETTNSQWLFDYRGVRGTEKWKERRYGFGPFLQFRRIRSMLSSNDRLSVLYYDRASFNRSVELSSYPCDYSDSICHSDWRFPCYQSLMLCNLDNLSVIAEFELTDCNGAPLD